MRAGQYESAERHLTEALERAARTALVVDLVEDVEEAVDCEVAGSQVGEGGLAGARQPVGRAGPDVQHAEVRVAEDLALELYHFVGEGLHRIARAELPDGVANVLICRGIAEEPAGKRPRRLRRSKPFIEAAPDP